MTRNQDPVFQAQALRRRYAGQLVVADFTATVHAGEVVVLVGPNGCGKTTSVEMALGLRKTEQGRSEIAGFDPRRHRREVARVVGVQLQGAALHARVRLREHLDYLGRLYGTAPAHLEVASSLGLDEFLGRAYGALSGGLQRRALVASALTGRPRFAVLDEPTSGVDIESRLQLWAALRTLTAELGTGILATSHDLNEAEQHADRVLVMRNGNIVAQGTPSAIVRDCGVASVLAVRREDVRGADWPPDGHGGWVLQSSAVELTLGFPKPETAGKVRATLESVQPRLHLIERSPTLADAYLALGAGPPPELDRPVGGA